MGTTPGSDSERMMAEIEAFLRTGEAPPAAPEPDLPPKRLQNRPYDLHRGRKGVMAGGRAPWLRLKRGRPGVGREGPGNRYGHEPGLWRRWQARLARRRTTGPGRWGGDGWSSSGWPPGAGLPHDPPRWTPLRIVVVVGVILALLIVPGLFPSHSEGTSGTDHASSAPAGPGYAFLAENPSGTPVRWNPCQPITYETHLSGAPAWFGPDVSLALAEISAQTGIRFVDLGNAAKFPTARFPGSGTKPSPVVIDWATADQAQQLKLTGSAAGVDGLARTSLFASKDPRSGQLVYASGSVVVAPSAAGLPHDFEPGGLGVLLYHEMGQLMGLGQVVAANEIMNRQVLSTPVYEFGPGDLTGLERLGSGSGCLPAPAGGQLQAIG